MSRRNPISLWKAITDAFPSRLLSNKHCKDVRAAVALYFLYLYIGTAVRRVDQSLRR
ncbi:hypothetical protein M441DRAFT_306977, partial [Trichoderma asperellum CBS 433.97]